MLKKEIFEVFDELIKETIDSSYIMAMSKIKNLLEYIVRTPEFIGLISNSMKDIDYRKEFLNSVKVSQSGKEYLELPESGRYLLSVCIGVLYDIDKDNTILSLLMNRFYPNKNINISYSDFVFSILNPFSLALKKMLSFDENSIDGDEITVENISRVAPDVILESVAPLIKEMNTAIMGDNKLTDIESRDLIVLVNGLYHAISISDMILIKSSYISLTYVLDFKRKFRNILSKLTKEMTRYSLL